MKKRLKVSATIGITGILAVLFFSWMLWRWNSEATKPGPLDVFAQCLNDKGAVFYGAFWCPHCQNQKALFGSSARYLNYVECSLPNGQGQTAQCDEKGIKGYPTWEFGDGSRLAGELKLEKLAEKTGCALPEEK